MKKQFKTILMGSAALILAAMVSCNKVEEMEEYASTIRFGVSTIYENGPATKTEYSGKDQTNSSISSTSTAERIDWLSTDKIRILCNQASVTGSSDKFADYAITPGEASTTSAQYSATISPVSGSGLTWGTQTTHNFFALYPSTVQNSAATIAVNGETGATVHGTIPATQTATLSGRIFKPDMDYAYMYAVRPNVATGTDVTLNFMPLVTTLEFTLLTKAGDPITSKLTSVKLSSSQTTSYLTGAFTANLTTTGLTALTKSSITGGGNEITITLPDGGVQLSTDPAEAYTVTFLTLPMDQTELTLTLGFADSSVRTVKLKDSGSWITVHACKKTYIWKLNAPLTTYTYTIAATSTSGPLVKAGTAKQYSVTSYKTSNIDSETTAEPWVAEFSTDGITWSGTAPSWLTTFTTSGPGSVSASNYSVGAAANNTASGWMGSTTPIATSKGSAHDLSCYDIYGTYSGGTERSVPYNTANCYVVSAPGWYCFPCVYGNAITGGADNTNAYQKGAADAEGILGAFKNHADNGITDPWIKNNSISIDGAELLWQTTNQMIRNVSFDSDYIYFYVDPSNIAQGNAVITAKASSTVVWSWHIWVRDNPALKLETKAVYSNTSYPSVTNPNYMLPINLGYIDPPVSERSVMVRLSQPNSGQSATITITQVGDKDGYCIPFYQWGRKDPSHPALGSQLAWSRVYYGEDGSSYINTQPLAHTPTGTIGASIQDPDNMFVLESTYPGKWIYSTRYDNIWNYNQTAIPTGVYWTDVPVGKTVYDPCPPGFKVPSRNAFSGFSISGTTPSAWNNTTMNTYGGYYFYTNPSAPTDRLEGLIFFPASGRNNAQDSQTNRVTLSGYYWTAGFTQHNLTYGDFAHMLEFDKSDVYINNGNNLSFLNAIRPVQE